LKTDSTNVERKSLVRLLRKMAREQQVRIWREVADHLEKQKRRRVAVNLGRINRNTTNRDVVIVPGKTLSDGLLEHSVTVSSLSFSEKAREKIHRAGGSCLRIDELVKQKPKGSKIKILT